jgi:hypothetical protein
MLNPMLKAISKMLDAKPEDTIFPRVACAKQVLDELIEHLEKEAPKGPTIVYPADMTPFNPNQGFEITGDADLDPEAQKAQEELMND